MNTRRYSLALAGGLVALALLGCSRESDTTTTAASPGEPTTGEQVDRALNEASSSAKQALEASEEALSETWEDIKGATYEQRASFQVSLRNLQTRIEQKVNELEASYPNASPSGLDRLREARDDFKEQINDLSNATETTWSTTKTELSRAWDRLQQSFAEFRKASAM